MKNKETCLECYNKKTKYCEICKRNFMGYDDHMKLHKAKNARELSGNLFKDIWNNIVSPSSQYCKYRNRTVDETNYYFSIKKCRDCHQEYKKEKIHCDKCNKSYTRASSYKHKCKSIIKD